MLPTRNSVPSESSVCFYGATHFDCQSLPPLPLR